MDSTQLMLDGLVQHMDDWREELVIIFAGYTREMNQFGYQKPGLRSRISFFIDFPDYDGNSLAAIAQKLAHEQSWSFTRAALDVLAPKLGELSRRGRQWAPGAGCPGEDHHEQSWTALDVPDLSFPEPGELGEALQLTCYRGKPVHHSPK